ncbi:ABC-type glycerol-3-phosphate transport system, substrate-binding protein [Pseudobutyrivibrio sp. OR37]|uniref:ABC transporter substrate-binding protein n=1 Tax=Pseudobutyrivibrio sp. OR37 TaxID=1798186 RepID=UPI0008EDEB11|nr:ABC transporter substrate-binding protein [Pseudobutyrivibrio sp. OR37]SFI24008.1 ABC-type glycerol-3-phosphate transport system, substrate-binding protein [Pseudobutyrivibrio sp. OR37]
MKRRVVVLCLLMSIIIGGCGNAAQSGESQVSDISNNKNEPIEIIWWTYTPDGTACDDAEEVLKKANEISAEKIGVTAKIIYKTEEQFDLDLQTGDYYDMAFSCDWCNDFDGNAGKGYYADITEKVQEVAPQLYQAVDPWWEVGTLHGKIYGVPMLKDLGAEVFFRMNSDYFEDEKGMTLPEKMSFADLEPYLKQWKEDHPEDYPFYIPNSGLSGAFQVHERIVSKYLVIPYSKAGTAEGTKIIPVFDDMEYMGMLKNLHKWYELSYINPDAATTTEVPKSIQTPVRTGTAWTGFMGWSDPEAYGFNVKLVRFIGPNMSRSTQQGSLIAINAAASEKNVEACLKYMELMYTDRQFRDTLAYGIEGKHFEYYKDTVIRLPEGSEHYMQDAFITGPAVSASVVSADKENLADPKQWEKVYEGYKDARVSDTKGFSFDPTNVEAEIAALDAIWSSYSAELVTGTSDTDKAVAEMRELMEAAGLEKVREEAQRQLDEYLKQFD